MGASDGKEMIMATGTVTSALTTDARKFTLDVDLSKPADGYALTSKGKSNLLASTGWVKDEATGLTYNLVVVAPFERTAELAEMQAAADAPKAEPKTRSRVKAA